MTIKLAIDNTNVEEFPGINLSDVAQCLRAAADQIEGGALGSVENAVLVVETENGIETFNWGMLTNAKEAIGLLAMAQTATILQQIGDVE